MHSPQEKKIVNLIQIKADLCVLMNDKGFLLDTFSNMLSYTTNKKKQTPNFYRFQKPKLNKNVFTIRLALSYCVNLVKKLFPIPDPIKVYNDRLIRLVAIQLFIRNILKKTKKKTWIHTYINTKVTTPHQRLSVEEKQHVKLILLVFFLLLDFYFL